MTATVQHKAIRNTMAFTVAATVRHVALWYTWSGNNVAIHNTTAYTVAETVRHEATQNGTTHDSVAVVATVQHEAVVQHRQHITLWHSVANMKQLYSMYVAKQSHACGDL